MVELRDNKEKFKNTEVGVIPKDWDVVNFGETSKIKARIGWQGLTTKEYKTSGDYYLITGTDFINNRIKWQSCFFVDKYRYLQDSNIQIKDGDVLITKDGTIGKIAYVDNMKKPATLNSGVFVVRPINERYNPKFLFYILNSFYFEKFLNQLSAGSTISHLYQKDIVKFNFPCPSKEEQELIVSALSDVDDLILDIEKLIDKKKLIKQGTQENLLTGKIRLNGFNDEWNSITLENITTQGGLVRGPFGGSLKKEFFVNKGYKVYEQKNAIYEDFRLGNYFIDEKKYKELIRFEVNPGDFIVSCSGTIGKIYCIPQNAPKGVINQALLKIKLNNNIIDNGYFKHYFSWDKFQNKIVESTQGGAMKNLVGMDVFKNTSILIPTINEQKLISEILTTMDNEIETLELKLNKYKNIKNGMMEELLTGKRRLV